MPSPTATTGPARILLVVLLTAVGSIAVAGAAWHAWSRASQAISRSATDRLTSIRETKRREITAYLSDTVAEIERLARTPWVVGAMEQFDTNFDTIGPTGQNRELVAGYYDNEIGPRLSRSRSPVSAAELVPEDAAAIAAQAAYVVRDSLPAGAKDGLGAADDASPYAEVHARFHGPFADLIQTSGQYDLLLIAADDGRIVYSVSKEIDFGTRLIGGPHRDSNLARGFRKVIGEGGNAFIVDFQHYAPSGFAPAAFALAPIRSGGVTIGVLAVQLSVDRLDSIMTGDGNWRSDGLGETGETYLVGRDGLMRSRSRFLIEDRDRFLAQLPGEGIDEDTIARIASFDTTILFLPVQTAATRKALGGSSGTERMDDYRGVPVLSSYAPLTVAGLEWAILSEIDADEAFAAVRTLGNQIALLTAGVMAAFLIAAGIVSRALARSERMSIDKAHTDRDLAIAREIQLSLLPRSSPVIAGYDIAGWSQPADLTGGDYYDWQALPGDRLVVTVADVTGHGIGPALVTAVCRAYARASIGDDFHLNHVLSRVNNFLHEDLPSDRFVTMVVGLLDVREHQMDLLSAGHGPLLVYSASAARVESLRAHDMPLGLAGQIAFDGGDKRRLEPGDIVLLITDGFFEWKNRDGEQFGIDRLNQCLIAHAHEPANEIIAHLYQQVVAFSEGTIQSDDLTALIVKRNAGS